METGPSWVRPGILKANTNCINLIRLIRGTRRTSSTFWRKKNTQPSKTVSASSNHFNSPNKDKISAIPSNNTTHSPKYSTIPRLAAQLSPPGILRNRRISSIVLRRERGVPSVVWRLKTWERKPSSPSLFLQRRVNSSPGTRLFPKSPVTVKQTSLIKGLRKRATRTLFEGSFEPHFWIRLPPNPGTSRPNCKYLYLRPP